MAQDKSIVILISNCARIRVELQRLFPKKITTTQLSEILINLLLLPSRDDVTQGSHERNGCSHWNYILYSD